jgi:general secretion pathway protein E
MARLPYSFTQSQGILLLDADTDETEPEALVRRGAPLTSLAELRRFTGKPLRWTLLENADFDRRLSEIYAHGEASAAEVADDIGQDADIARLVEDMPAIEDLLDSEHEAPIIRMINALLGQAVRENASDIHIEPFEQHSVVRFRHDGMLRDVVSPRRALHAAMVSRIKIMASLDIAEKRLPQDGRVSIRLAGKPVDIRVSTLPTSHGERVVMRLLHKSADRLDLATLGMAADTLVRMDQLIRQPHGIVLVTGPTGSGKTTTLYAALSRLDTKQLNIMTVEDPVEYALDGIGQIQVNPRIDLSFAKALRSILRQDPDIIMIGEIRDLETAQIAVQASLTGHLVLATLHTNDSSSAITRLVDMGIEPFLLASSLLGVLAQRLVRRLCPDCKQAYAPDDAELALLGGATPAQLYRPTGCPACNQTGYLGRSGIYELLEVDDALRRGIHDRIADHALLDIARRSSHLRLLRDDGLRWVCNGDTSLEELLRVTREQ